MNERKAVGLLLIIIFIFVYAYRNLESSLTETYLDIFVIGFFLTLIFLWQYISPSKKNKNNEDLL